MLLTDFCALTEPRKYLLKPMRIDHYLIACDGHRFVCTVDPASAPDAPENVAAILRDYITLAEQAFYQPINRQIALPDTVICPHCEGSGKADLHECPICEGNGVDEFGIECTHCAGEGVLTVPSDDIHCRACNGTGQFFTLTNQQHGIDLGGVLINPKYVQQLLLEPDAEISPSGQLEILFFRAAGFLGSIKGMRG